MSYWTLALCNGVEELNCSSTIKREVVATSCKFVTETEHGHRAALFTYAYRGQWLAGSLSQMRCEFATSAMKEKRYVQLALVSAEKWHLIAQRQLRASLKYDSWLQLSSCSKSRIELNEVDKLTTYHGTYAGKSYESLVI